MAIYNNEEDPNEKMWEKQNIVNSRLEKHKDLLSKIMDINNEIMDIQEEKFKILTDFLEYEEALTKDKDSATRIRKVLESLGVWEKK